MVELFEKKGVIFETNIEKIPTDSVLVFSAHGVSPDFKEKCKKKKLKIIDATCPLVNKVHQEAKRFAAQGYKIFFIGHKYHQEAQGTLGVVEMQLIETKEDANKIEPENLSKTKAVCLTQTTLSLDETHIIIKTLKSKIPHLEVPKDICYATKNRQNAVKTLAKRGDFLIVIGSKNSSNSNRLVDTATSQGCKSGLFDNVEAIPEDVYKYEKVGLTSGASVPEVLVQQVIDKFQRKNKRLNVETIKIIEENLTFPLPSLPPLHFS